MRVFGMALLRFVGLMGVPDCAVLVSPRSRGAHNQPFLLKKSSMPVVMAKEAPMTA